MHEISLVRNIFKTLEAEFPDTFHNIRNIYLTAGELSNVQPILMKNAFDAVVLDEPKYAKTILHVEVLPVIIYCDDCNQKTPVNQYKFICGICNKPSKNVIQGEELLISKVEFEK
jgi:hydrogenase nickel incorporation protein HypA/HybF